jgi:hypothetical protein
MFENLEVRKTKNGFIVTVNSEDGSDEYVFATARKAIQFLKEYIELKPTDNAE